MFRLISSIQRTNSFNQFVGLFITEALHPFLVFKKAGFDVDLVSETGTYQPDWLSEQKDWLNDEDRAIWEDHSSEFRSKLDRLLKPSDIDPKNVWSYIANIWSVANAMGTVWHFLRFCRPRLVD